MPSLLRATVKAGRESVQLSTSRGSSNLEERTHRSRSRQTQTHRLHGMYSRLHDLSGIGLKFYAADVAFHTVRAGHGGKEVVCS